MTTLWLFRNSRGSLFHSIGPERAKARSPKVLKLVLGILSRPWSQERRWWPVTEYGCKYSWMYCGPGLLRDFKLRVTAWNEHDKPQEASEDGIIILWKAITFLCGHSLLHDVVSSLCDVVSPLCDVVLSLCVVVSPLCDVVLSLCDVVLPLCNMVSPLRGLVSPLRGVVLSLCGFVIMWCGFTITWCGFVIMSFLGISFM